MSKISIVVPVFNSELDLRRCLDSISRQSYDDFEVILVNDGSTDNSAQICDEYVGKDSRYKVIHCKNSGVSIARNIGIDNASGKYISFIDSDDWVEGDFLKKMVDAVESSVDIIISGVVCDYSDGSCKDLLVDDSISDISSSKNFHRLVKSRLLYGPVAKLYKSDIIKLNNIKFQKGLNYGEDRLFNYEYMRYVTTVATVGGCRYHYVMHNSNSLTSRIYHNMFDLEYVQWHALYDIYQFHGNLTNEAKSDIYSELFLIINDNIFDSVQRGDYKLVKRILSIPDISDCKTVCHKIKCNPILKWCIFERKALSLYFIIFLIKLCK